MMSHPLGKRIDDILEVLYDASDVSSLHRKYIGKSFDKDLGAWVVRTVIDNADSPPNHSDDIQDLEHRVAKIEHTLERISIATQKR